MTYATVSQFVKQFGSEEIAQRADRSIPRLVTNQMLIVASEAGDLSGFTPEEQAATQTALALITSKLLDADSLINSYLMTGYTIPLPIVPRIVVSIACDLTRYALYDDQSTDQITQRYKDAIKMLESISKGTINLGIDTNAQPAVDAGSVKYSAPSRVFNDDSLAGF